MVIRRAKEARFVTVSGVVKREGKEFACRPYGKFPNMGKLTLAMHYDQVMEMNGAKAELTIRGAVLVLSATLGSGKAVSLEFARAGAAGGAVATTRVVAAPGTGAAGSGGTAKEFTLELGNGVRMRAVLIPPGQFVMGEPLPAGRLKSDYDNWPPRTVTISRAYYMGVTHVTQAQYQQVTGKNPSRTKGAENPVETVSRFEADDFCRTLSEKSGYKVRLPTEAEWEHACRAGSKTKWFFGDDPTRSVDFDWLNGKDFAKVPYVPTRPAGQKRPNPWGLCDMYGNVNQWVSDWWTENYQGAAVTDPKGPDNGKFSVVRGGSINGSWEYSYSARRGRQLPNLKAETTGFRVVIEPGNGAKTPP